MRRRWILLLAIVTAGIIAAACGSDDNTLGPARQGGDAAPPPTPTVLVSDHVDASDPGTPCPVASTGRPSVVATPGIAIDQANSYEALIKTNKGDIRIELFDDDVPVTVNNFVHLARCGYYDNITFHRVIGSFMAQSGDPTGSGAGGPGYTIPDEITGHRHDGPGVLSMANAGSGTGGSQFFITHVATPHLDGLNPDGSAKVCQAQNVSCHTVFGQVIDGQNVVNDLAITGPGVTPDTIETIEIIEK